MSILTLSQAPALGDGGPAAEAWTSDPGSQGPPSPVPESQGSLASGCHLFAEVQWQGSGEWWRPGPPAAAQTPCSLPTAEHPDGQQTTPAGSFPPTARRSAWAGPYRGITLAWKKKGREREKAAPLKS